MSYHERKSIMSMVTSTLVFVGYGWYVLNKYHQTAGADTDPVFWARALLILIPISIVAGIVSAILFSIGHNIATGEKQPTYGDERDKLIELKAMRNSMWIFVLGFFLAMGALVMGYTVSVMFILMASAGFIAEIIGNLSKLYFYGKGV